MAKIRGLTLVKRKLGTMPNKSKHADLVKLSLFCSKKVANFTKPVFEALGESYSSADIG